MSNVCIVGYGAIGPIHAKALETIPEANFYAVCDIDEEKIKKCCEIYNVKAYNDFNEMLKDDNIHSVHICTPHYLHYDMIVNAIEHDKKVITEKPVVMTLNELNQIMQFTDKNKIAIVFQNRLNTCVKKLKELVVNKTFGEVVCIRGILTWNRDQKYYESGEWRGKWATEGGGVLINQAVHTLDLMGYLGGGISSLKANMMNYSLQDIIEVEDTFSAMLKLKNGGTGIFFATNAYEADSKYDIEVVFENGTAHYVDDRLLLNGEEICHDTTVTGEKAYWGAGHEELIRNFYKDNIYFNIEEAKNTMYSLFAMYESAKNNGKEIQIIEI